MFLIFGEVKEMKRNRILMLCISVLQGFIFYGPISTIYRESRGVGMSQIFIIESVFLATSLLFEVPWGIIADRIGYRATIIISNTIFFISKIVFLNAYSFPAFVFERILLGIAISGLSGCDSALIYESLEGENAQKYFGRYYASGTVSFVAASIAGGIIAGRSYYLTAALTAVFYLLAAVLSLFLKEPLRNSKKEKNFAAELKGAIVFLKSQRSLVYISVLYGLLAVLLQAMVFLNQPQFIRSGINIAYFGIIISGLELVRISADKTHKLTQSAGEGRIFILVPLCIGIFYLVLSVTASPFITILSMALITGSYAVLQPLMVDTLNRGIKDGRATLLSIYSWIGSAAGIIVNPFIGRLSGESLNKSFSFLGCLGVAIAVLFYCIIKKGRLPERAQE
jgi:MFS family permease